MSNRLKPIDISVFRFVNATAWHADLTRPLVAEFGSDVEFTFSENLRTHHIGPHEDHRAAIDVSADNGKWIEDIRGSLDQVGFNDPLPVRIIGGTAIGRSNARIIIKLYPEQQLFDERHAAIDTIPWQPDFKPAQDRDYFFQVAIGKLHNKSRKVKLMHALTDLLPASLELQPGIFSVYE